MDTKQFNNLIAIVDLDIQVCVSGMINSKNYYDDEVVEFGSYIGASYTHFAKKENIEMNSKEKLSLINHICEFYNKLIRPNGITKEHAQLIKTKYFELLDEDPNIIQSYIESIVDVAEKYTDFMRKK
jgi:hypothetical protein